VCSYIARFGCPRVRLYSSRRLSNSFFRTARVSFNSCWKFWYSWLGSSPSYNRSSFNLPLVLLDRLG
jgi:hypothetical protein